MDIIEGRNPVIEALKADRPISKILLDKGIKGQGSVDQIIRLAKIRGIEIEVLDKQAMNRQSATGSYQGVMALAEAKKYISLHEMLAISEAKKEPALYLVLDGIEDPHNLGAILRTADATGVHGVVTRERRAVGITPAVTKASAGAVEYVPVAMVANIAQAIETLKKNGVWVIGIDMAGETHYSSVDLKLPTAIVIGGEGKGLSDLVRKRCDFTTFIPMKGHISSLNASVAAAVVMYEAFRQRTPQQ